MHEPDHRVEVEVVLVHGLEDQPVRMDRIHDRIELGGLEREVAVEERQVAAQRLERQVAVDLERGRERRR